MVFSRGILIYSSVLWLSSFSCSCRSCFSSFLHPPFWFFEVASSIAGANISPRPPALQGTGRPVFPEGKKVQDCDYVFGSSLTFQRRKKWICESRCKVSDRLHVFAVLFCPLTLSRLQFMLGLHFTPSLQSVILQFAPSVLLSVCSLHFTPGPQSAALCLRFTLIGLIISIYSSALIGASKETEQSSDWIITRLLLIKQYHDKLNN